MKKEINQSSLGSEDIDLFNSQKYKYYKEKANKSYKEQNYKAALAYINNAFFYNPKCRDYDPFYRLAKTQQKLESYPEALVSIEKAIKFNSEFKKLLFIKAEILYNMGSLAESEAVYESVLAYESRSDYKVPMYNKLLYANVLVEAGKFDKAIEIYDKLVGAFKPNFWELFNKAKILVKLGKSAEALDLYGKISDCSFYKSFAVLKKAKLLMNTNHLCNAEYLLNDYINANPMDVRGYLCKWEIKQGCSKNQINVGNWDSINLNNNEKNVSGNAGEKSEKLEDCLRMIKKKDKEIVSLKKEINVKDLLIKNFEESIEFKKKEIERIIEEFNGKQIKNNKSNKKDNNKDSSNNDIKCTYSLIRTKPEEIVFSIPKECVVENESKADFYNCAVCNNVVINPISCAYCDMFFCSKCLEIKQMQANVNCCPNCKVNFKEGKISKHLMGIINKLKIRCPLDCGWIFKYQEILTHFDYECSNVPKFFKCELCGIKIQINTLPEQEEYSIVKQHYEECFENILECEYCEDSFHTSVLQQHRNTCEHNTDEKCGKCGLVVLSEMKLLHDGYLCDLVSCVVDTNKG